MARNMTDPTWLALSVGPATALAHGFLGDAGSVIARPASNAILTTNDN